MKILLFLSFVTCFDEARYLRTRGKSKSKSKSKKSRRDEGLPLKLGLASNSTFKLGIVPLNETNPNGTQVASIDVNGNNFYEFVYGDDHHL